MHNRSAMVCFLFLLNLFGYSSFLPFFGELFSSTANAPHKFIECLRAVIVHLAVNPCQWFMGSLVKPSTYLDKYIDENEHEYEQLNMLDAIKVIRARVQCFVWFLFYSSTSLIGMPIGN